MTAAGKKILWRAVQIVLIGLIFYFLGKQLVENWGKVTAYDWHIRYPELIISTALCVFTFFIMSSVWRLIILSLGKNIGHRKAFKISYIAALGRYIPGKIWQMFGMILLAKKEGISEEITEGFFSFLSLPSSLCPLPVLCLSSCVSCWVSNFLKVPW